MRIRLVGRRPQVDRARVLMTSGQGVLLTGEPGVGKTRLLDEILRLLADDGWSTECFVASAATRSVPFGPLISLLPADATDRTQQTAGVRRALTERADGRRTALAIDDVNLLDDASLACLVDLVHHSDVVVIATARSTEAMPADLTALWAGDAMVRIDVDPLDRAESAELTELLLRGTPSPELAAQVWERTRGVPLFVRELLLDAAAQRLLISRAGRWLLRGELRTGARLQELVSARMAALTDPARDLLELLAVAEPVALDLLTEAEGAELDGLEQRGLARGEQLAGRWVARVDHPLITEAVAAAMPSRRRLEWIRRMAAGVIAADCPAPGDALRVAMWHQECGDPLPPDIAVSAGREALASLALDTAVSLARLALDDLPREGHLLLGEALRLQARAAEAEAALAVAADLADDDETIVRVAMWRSTLRAHHADDPEGAVALLNEAADRLSDAGRTMELRSEAAFLAGVLGRFDVAVRANRQILEFDGLDGPTRWTAQMNLLLGQMMLADVSDVDDSIETMAVMVESMGASRAEGVDLFWSLVSIRHLLSGDLVRCEAELVVHVQQCLADDQLHGITAATLVHPLLYRGSPYMPTMAVAGCESIAQADAYLISPIAHSGLVIARASVGDLAGARSALNDVDDSHRGDRRLDGFVGRARAAVLALEGQRDHAADIVASAGRDCVEGTFVLFGVLAMYDAVRYGRADLVAEDLDRIATDGCAPLIRLLARHAVAQYRRDVPALVAIADALATMGARTLVAEALQDAALAADNETHSARASTAASLWRRSAPVDYVVRRPVDTPLTDRELDVVERVLHGQSSKTVAEDLFLSVRTVDNHLAQVYRKLGVNSRADLRSALAVVPDAA